jgi:hypothetical protein
VIKINEMVTIVHNDYEKISDTVFWLSKEWIMKFVVQLNKYSEKNGRENFYKEFGYQKKGNFCVSINRDFNYYFLIESVQRDSNGFKYSLMITQQDIYFLQFKLSKAVEWFTGDSSIFAKKGEDIIIPSKVYTERVNLITNTYIELEPSVIRFDNGNQIIGVRFYLGNDTVNFFMDVNRFLSFNYFISTFNMYLAAQGLLSYLGRPQNGTNHINMSALNSSNQNSNYNSNQTSSFFDRVNAKKN